MPNHKTTVAGRGLGAELRAARERSRLSMRNVAERLNWQSSKVSRIENGQQGMRPEDVSALLVIYGITGEERERLLARCEKTDEPGLWEVHGGLSRESRTLVQLEAEATTIVNVEALWIPGLLQTHDYTRAVMKACRVAEEDIEIRVATRMGRQAVLGRDGPPECEFIIDEGALRRPVLPPRLMARQLRHIRETAERPNVTVRVLPVALGAHNGLEGSLELLGFASNRPVAYLDHGIAGFFLEEDHQVAFYQGEIAQLRDLALIPDESVELTATIAKDHETDEGS